MQYFKQRQLLSIEFRGEDAETEQLSHVVACFSKLFSFLNKIKLILPTNQWSPSAKIGLSHLFQLKALCTTSIFFLHTWNSSAKRHVFTHPRTAWFAAKFYSLSWIWIKNSSQSLTSTSQISHGFCLHAFSGSKSRHDQTSPSCIKSSIPAKIEEK